MAITEADIKLLQSARMTDNPDGGGRMTGNVVQSGVDNNIFDDVSNLSRVYGEVSLRKVFAGVMTNTTDKYLGARVIIDEPPADDYVDGVLFGASSLFDTREAAKGRVEAYLATGGPYQGFLYGPHITGMMAISLLQMPTSPLPVVGGVYVLHQENTGGLIKEQFVRITAVASKDVVFVADGESFTRNVVTCNTTDALRYDFGGHEATRDTPQSFENKARVFETVVANASSYFGIKALERDAAVGDFQLKAASSLAQLLPSAQIEVPISDTRTNGSVSIMAPAAVGTITSNFLCPTTTNATHIGCGILPGSITISAGGSVTDVNGVLRLNGNDVGSVDYANGILRASVDFYSRSAVPIAFTPAVATVGTVNSVGRRVTLENRSLSFAFTIYALPAAGSVTLHYLSEGKWYVLSDTGAGTLSGPAGAGAGAISYGSGTVVATMGALPDVGSAIIVQWVTQSSITPHPALPMVMGGRLFGSLNAAKTLSPHQVSLSWTHQAQTLTLTDDGTGVLSGSGGVGSVDYQSGLLRFVPAAGFPPKGTILTLTTSSAVSKLEDITFQGARYSATSVGITFSLPPNVLPRSVSFYAQVRAGSMQAQRFLGVFGGTLRITDDGLGTLLLHISGAIPSRTVTIGSIDYPTGGVSLSVDAAILASCLYERQEYIEGQYRLSLATPTPEEVAGIYAITVFPLHLTGDSVNWEQFSVRTVAVTYANSAAAPDTVSAPLDAVFLQAEFIPAGCALGGVSFVDSGHRFVGTASGNVIMDPDPNTGNGVVVGEVFGTQGIVALSSWPAGLGSGAFSNLTAQAIAPASGPDARFNGSYVMFRVPTAPLRPGSLQVLGKMQDGTTLNVAADSSGRINAARVKGFVSHESGVVELQFCSPSATDLGTADVSAFGIPGVTTVNADLVLQDTLRYNAVAYSHLPLNADILGLDPVRLPSDGRVPIFKAGRVVVVHNTVKRPPQTVTNGVTVDCGRTLLSRIRVFGGDALEITSGFTKNLDAGTITFTNVAGMVQPVTIEHRIEDEALCADVQITGDIRISRPLTHAYPADTSYVSSAYIAGTLQAAAQDAFSQETWTNEWSDSRIGNPILAQYNDTANPISVTNAGAITERWALVFTSNTEFNVVGEEVGLIIAGNTATPLAPVNPATGVPYFTLPSGGWGGGWVAGNVLRFNTRGANFPLWIARTVRQSPSAPPGSDQMTISIRGDIDQ